MADYTVKKIDELEAVFGGAFKRARAELGVSSFGMQVMDLPANLDQYPEHDESESGQEEVYLALNGTAKMEVEGETITLDPETLVRVGPGTSRTIRTGDEGARLLVLGGKPGAVYEPPEVTELGAPDPMASS